MRHLIRVIAPALSLIFIGCVSPDANTLTVALPEKSDVAAPSCSDKQVLTRFHELWYNNKSTWRKNTWMGIETWQNPNDIWIAQEVIFETKPDVIVETGAYKGGSAAIWAMILKEVNPDGRVISIDVADRFEQAKALPSVKERVDFIVGISTSPEVVEKIKKETKGKKVLIILDSSHKKRHVLNELSAYWDIVPIGSYIHVQSTNIGGHPVRKDFGAGPMEAVTAFLKTNKHFAIDKSRERLLFTLHPNGWLKRVN